MTSVGQSGEAARPRSANGNGAMRDEAATVSSAPRETQLSVIGADILVTGDIEAEVDLQIEGRVVGDVHCATLILGERSSVTGNVSAKRVRVSGMVEGSVETIDLAIEAGARVKGEVTYSRLRIANGGLIEGTMTHRPLSEEELAETGRLKLVPEHEPAPPPAKVHYIE